ncbi:hypothetical protein [Aliagarivorans marinus]|uniref:hypothetical protein n=1 Tax=Aliagarivorans marinus TaxID=561965 RepID=UPI0003FB621B|nr:hypothetical protein [Aliagarivorans marinus]
MSKTWYLFWFSVGLCAPLSSFAGAGSDSADYIQRYVTESGLEYSYISFDDIAPAGYQLNQSWNGMGMDDRGRIYIGWTSLRSDGLEDFVTYSYDPHTEQRRLIGSMMMASQQAGNLLPGEAIPKGHTEIVQVGSKMYMASQSFHDFKREIDELPNYRGAHLYEYDMETGVFRDVSAVMSGGVVLEHEGIVGLAYDAPSKQLVGISHPHYNMVFLDINQLNEPRIVEGIPWQLGNPLSREVIVDKHGKVYLYRGTERTEERNQRFNMWVYDTKSGTLSETDQQFNNGFWAGQAHTKAGDTIYISTVNGGLFALDTASGKVSDLGDVIVASAEVGESLRAHFLYDIILSQDERAIYALPAGKHSDLFRYDIESAEVTRVASLPDDVYSGNNLMGENGDIYLAKFKAWSGEARLMILHGVGKE